MFRRTWKAPLCLLRRSDVSFPLPNTRVITPRGVSFPGPEIIKIHNWRLLRVPSFNRTEKSKGERKEGKEGVSDGLGWFNPDPGSRGRSGQPEVFRFYSGRDLGIRKAGEKEKKGKNKITMSTEQERQGEGTTRLALTHFSRPPI